MIYFTADSHFGHSSAIDYCKRPYVCLEEMDDSLVDNGNSVIKQKDIVYHLLSPFFIFILHYFYRIQYLSNLICPLHGGFSSRENRTAYLRLREKSEQANHLSLLTMSQRLGISI